MSSGASDRSAPARPRWVALPTARLSLSRLMVFAAFVAIFLMALKPLDDVFYHLAAGRYILASGHVPLTDPFSWTAAGRAWVAHEWLLEIAVYLLYLHGHTAVLLVVFAALVTAAFACAYATARLLGAAPPIALAVTLLAAGASYLVLGVRPQMCDLLLGAVMLWTLTRATLRDQPHLLWLLPPLQLLWANLHAGFIIGLVLVGCLAIDRTIPALGPRFRRGKSAVSWRWPGRLWGIGSLCLGACLLTPNGLRLLVYPFTYLGDNASMRYITEWASPNFHAPLFRPFEALLLLLVVGALLAPGRPRLADILLAVLLTHMALTSLRHIGLFCVLLTPLIASQLTRAWEALWQENRVSDKLKRIRIISARAWPRPAHAALMAVLLVGLLGGAVRVATPRLDEGYSAAFQARLFPVGAVAYIRAHPLDGPLFNDVNWGSYLLWTLYPQERVYVDGRPDLYGDAFINQYMALEQARPGWTMALAAQGVRWVLVGPQSGLGRALAGTLGWQLIYADGISVLYRRLTP